MAETRSTGSKAAAALAAALGLAASVALCGCEGPSPVPRPTATDPMALLPDPAPPLIHLRGRGARSIDVPPQPKDVLGIEFWVTCTPDAHFTVRMGSFFSGPCTDTLLNSGTIPLAEDHRTTTVRISLPDDVDFWLVGSAQRKGDTP